MCGRLVGELASGPLRTMVPTRALVGIVARGDGARVWRGESWRDCGTAAAMVEGRCVRGAGACDSKRSAHHSLSRHSPRTAVAAPAAAATATAFGWAAAAAAVGGWGLEGWAMVAAEEREVLGRGLEERCCPAVPRHR